MNEDERTKFPSKNLVLGFLDLGDFFMLSVRRRPPWLGCISGLGGGVEDCDLGIFDAMRREARQEAEITVCPLHMEKRGEFKIFRQGKEMVLLHVFVFHEFEGEITTTDEMGPHDLFLKNKLPIKDMILGDKFWVKRIFDGEFLLGEIYTSADSETLISISIGSCDPFF